MFLYLINYQLLLKSRTKHLNFELKNVMFYINIGRNDKTKITNQLLLKSTPY